MRKQLIPGPFSEPGYEAMLQHAAKGRNFVRRMIDLSMVAKKAQDHLRLNKAFHSDLEWWHYFVGQWNGILLLAPFQRQHADGEVTSDASGNWGCGAFHGLNGFKKWKYNGSRMLFSSTSWTKSIFPSWLQRCSEDIAGLVWPLKLAVTIRLWLKLSTEGLQEAIRLLRCLSFSEARFGWFITAKHISRIHNTLADTLSRDNVPFFLSHFPQASHVSAKILPEILRGSADGHR